MSEQQAATEAMERVPHPQSTPLGVYDAPSKSSAMTTVVPLDRENLAFFANMINAAGLVPQVNGVTKDMSFNRAMAKIVAGTAYGFDPVLSQSCFDVLFNALGPNAKGQGILFRRSGEFDLRIIEHSDKGCKAKILKRVDGVWDAERGQFTGGRWTEIGIVEFNEEMAKKAKLLENTMYQKFGPDMYYARVVTRAVKRYNPTCLLPTVVLGNHFARESQSNYLPPQAAPQPDQLEKGSDEAPEQTANGGAAIEHIDPDFVDTSIIAADDEIEGEVTDLAPQEFSGPPQTSTPIVDKAESLLADLRIAATEKFRELEPAAQAKASKFLGTKGINEHGMDKLTDFINVDFSK